MSRIEGPLALDADINKENPYYKDETKTGVVSELLPELTLDIPDDELVELSQAWFKKWDTFSQKFFKKQKENAKYWKGQQYSDLEYPEEDANADRRPLVDNKLFEATETFLPIATRANPEPVVVCENDELKKMVQDKLIEIADTLRLKLKIKDVARHWLLGFVGVASFGWDEKNDREKMDVIRPQQVILDPTATVTEGVNYTGSYIGVYQKEQAKDIVAKWPEITEFLTAKVESKMATEVRFIWWSTNEYCFYTIDKQVFGKSRNLYWNYEQEIPGGIDAFGQQLPSQIQAGRNHFKSPRMPFQLLSIWNLGEQPVDQTNVFYQNLAIQDLINKRYKQIDINNDNVNGGWAFSGEKTGMTKDQATEAVAATRQGGALFIANGSVGDDAVKKMIGQPLPPNSYEQLQDSRIELQNVFGTAGSTPQGIKSEDTVRGKILAKGTDDSRIGGGVTEYLEQFADSCYNWFVQLEMVFNPEFAALVTEPIKVTIKEGSMIPKDSLTRRNEAIDLFTAGALSPIDLYKRLEDPNPEETYANLLKWLIDQQAPQLMVAEHQQNAQMAQQQSQQVAQAQQIDVKGQQAIQQKSINPSAPDLLKEVPIGA